MLNGSLAVEHTSVSYGAGVNVVRALDDVSVSFRPGQLSLVMGPSGSGKTTLLSILGCLLTPDAGQVWLMNNRVTELSEKAKGKLRRRYIGYVFQAFRLFRALSALDNILIALELSGRKGRPAVAAARQALDEVGLSGKAHLRPSELSGGEKQRVAIARALVNDPPIILADEPTASLDHQSGEQIAEILKNLARQQNRIVVIVSHDSRWLDKTDRTITLVDGKLVDEQVRA